MEQIPETVEILYLTEHSNLQPRCVEGMDKLTNLKELHIDLITFGFADIFVYPDGYVDYCNTEDIIPIPNLDKLKTMRFCSGIMYTRTDLKENWIDEFIAHPLFVNIEHRIIDVTFSDDYKSEITLNLGKTTSGINNPLESYSLWKVE
jgi:hypothetical protein